MFKIVDLVLVPALAFLVFSIPLAGSSPTASAAEFFDTFHEGSLNTYPLCGWNHRKQGTLRLIGFGTEPVGGGTNPQGPPENGWFQCGTTVDESKTTRFIKVSMDHERCTKNCPGQAPKLLLTLEDLLEDDPLGPGFIADPPAVAREGGDCHSGERRNGKEVTQRNELRLRNFDLWHQHGNAHWYDIRFMMTGDIFKCGSARQIIGQWKYNDPGWDAAHGALHQSPYLAQRFDNGVFHLTVQSHTCRCMIAKAVGDPDTRALQASREPAQEDRKLHDVDPLACKTADNMSTEDGETCTPTNLKLKSFYPEGPGILPSPNNNWVRMTYLVKGDGEGQGVLDVYADNRFVVRVKGVLGYTGGKPDMTKFKFGIYRARVTGKTDMKVDHVCFSKDISNCNPDLEPIDPMSIE